MLSETVKTELDAQWDDLVIDKPNMSVGQRNAPLTAKGLPKIIVSEGTMIPNPQFNGSAQIEDETVLIKFCTKTSSDVDLVYSEVKRITEAKSLPGGWWRIQNRINNDNPHFIETDIEMHQVLWVANS